MVQSNAWNTYNHTAYLHHNGFLPSLTRKIESLRPQAKFFEMVHVRHIAAHRQSRKYTLLNGTM